jgi:hypothetical protein
MVALLVTAAVVLWLGWSGRGFGGMIQYRNQSAVDIWVEDVTGFGRPVECGVLVPGKWKQNNMGPLPLPKTTTIRWRMDGKNGEPREAMLDLAGLSRTRYDAMLIFEYTSEGTWVARFEER